MIVCDICKEEFNLSRFVITIGEENCAPPIGYHLELCKDCKILLSINAIIIGMKEIRKHTIDSNCTKP